MTPEIIEGDLLTQKVAVIVNAWNRNIFPWWLLLPQGVSGAIKRQAGLEPFRELSRMGMIELGGARVTSAGNLPYQAIIHVAGINLLWFATEFSVRESVRSAMKVINEKSYESAAFPLIGSGSGNRGKDWSRKIMLDEFEKTESNAAIKLVIFKSA